MTINIKIGYPESRMGIPYKTLPREEKIKMLVWDIITPMYNWFIPMCAGIGIERFSNHTPSVVFFAIMGVIPLLFPLWVEAVEDVKKAEKVSDSVPV